MNRKLFVDMYNRKLVKSVASDFPVSLPTIFREDWIDLEVTLLEPTGTITSPVSVVDVAALQEMMLMGIPEASARRCAKATSESSLAGLSAGIAVSVLLGLRYWGRAKGDPLRLRK